MLSLHTNNAALSAQNSIARTQDGLSTSMTRLSTGYRINSAMDDAAGLQIATRLKSQTSGMAMAMRNTQNGISMLQTAEGALDETTNILIRMKDLATQAADATSSGPDQTAMQAEYDALANELSNVVGNTAFGSTKLMNDTTGKLSTAGGIKFQIGASASEQMAVNVAPAIAAMHTALSASVASYDSTGIADATVGTELTAAGGATLAIGFLTTAIDKAGEVRSALGAAANRLDHVYNNLSNISTNTKAAAGRIMDVDFAAESSAMTSNQMLLQAGTAMLKQSNSSSSLVMSLLQ